MNLWRNLFNYTCIFPQLFWQAVNVAPQLWQPVGGVLMINDINSTTPEEARPCSMALCNDNDHLLSVSGDRVYFYTMMADKVLNVTILHGARLYEKVETSVLNSRNTFVKSLHANKECLMISLG